MKSRNRKILQKVRAKVRVRVRVKTKRINKEKKRNFRNHYQKKGNNNSQ